MNTLAIETKDLTKAFGSVVAAANVNLRIKKGTIHGIIGENGAGKSTALKMLYGMVEPDAGEILINGAAKRWHSPKDAMNAGIGMVHQHFMLAEPVSALDNILLDRAANPFSKLPRKQVAAELRQLAQRYGLEVDFTVPAGELSVGLQQRLEILKILYRRADIIILDEPTAVLTPQETTTLFEQLRELRAQGKTICLITHKLQEVMAITDEVSVFRAGRIVGERVTQQTSSRELAELMIGRQLKSLPPRAEYQNRQSVLEVEALSLPPRLHEVSFRVNAHEILGIAGVEGNGQSELLSALLTPLKGVRGSARIFNQDHIENGSRRLTPAQFRRLGVGVLPEDRQRQGLLMNRPLHENFLLGFSREYQRNGFLKIDQLRQQTASALQKFNVRPGTAESLARDLSGGNQQKFVVARELQNNPGLIFACHPTRGVDIGAIEFIHDQLLQARAAGAGILLISSELEEIMALADRILVFFHGRIVGEFKRSQFNEREIGQMMCGDT